MIDSEILEAAEADGYYTFVVDSADGLELSNKADRVIPNGYLLISEYSDRFTESEGIVQATDQVIDVIQVSGGLLDTHRDPTKGR